MRVSGSRTGRGHSLRSRTVILAAGSLLACAAPPAVSVAASRAGAAPTLTVGSQTLTRCGASPLYYCGKLSVPLDHSVPSGPHISIAYRWYPASAPSKGKAAGTAVPVEGGPGYPSSGSVEGGYSVMYGPLLKRWNLLAVDNRGTGRSMPPQLRCAAGVLGPDRERSLPAGRRRMRGDVEPSLALSGSRLGTRLGHVHLGARRRGPRGGDRSAAAGKDRSLRRLLRLVLRPGLRVALPQARAQRDPRLDLPDQRPRPLVSQQRSGHARQLRRGVRTMKKIKSKSGGLKGKVRDRMRSIRKRVLTI